MLKISKSHYSAALQYPENYHNSRMSSADRKVASELRKSQMDTLKALGWQEQYRQFRDGDAAGEAAAKARAEADAARWAEKTGFVFNVSKGFFMGF